MQPKQRITLCAACEECPEVAVYEEEVQIGEEGNLVTLRKQEWNELVNKIKTGELGEV
jgi:hypothetical protein